MRNPMDPFRPAVELRSRRADDGTDAPFSGLLPPTLGGLTLACLSAYHHSHGRRALASLELLSGVPMLLTAAVFLHATRRGKFQIRAELLEDTAAARRRERPGHGLWSSRGDGHGGQVSPARPCSRPRPVAHRR